MSIRISDVGMSSDRVSATARPVDAQAPYGPWCVSWLGERQVGRNQAITAMTLAEHLGANRDEDLARVIVFCQGWAEELGLSLPEVQSLLAADLSRSNT